jgi:hypothetical protein
LAGAVLILYIPPWDAQRPPLQEKPLGKRPLGNCSLRGTFVSAVAGKPISYADMFARRNSDAISRFSAHFDHEEKTR